MKLRLISHSLGVLDLIRVMLTVITPINKLVQGSSVPGRPRNVTLFADTNEIGVTWTPPNNDSGIVRKYIVSWAILPDFTDTRPAISVDGHVNVSIIPIGGNAGRLYRVRVRAQNEAGLGPYSRPRFIRTGCGKSFYLEPRVNLMLSSPEFGMYDLRQGVFCVWNITTSAKFVLSFHAQTLDITKNKSPSKTCLDTYVNITGYGKLCRGPVEPFQLQSSVAVVTLRTGTEAIGSGFQLLVSSVPRLPGQPVKIGVHALPHGIVVTWQQPIENTLPITSYEIQYSVVSLRRTFKILVAAHMRQFSVNTRHYEGKLLTISLTAVMGQLKGQRSRSQYIRASCQRNVILTPGEIRNISSPNYPSHYPTDIICTWNVTTTSRFATRLQVTFLDFRLEVTPSCRHDFLLVSFNTTKKSECIRMILPKTLVLEQDYFTITFVTDGINEFEGFLIQVENKVLTSQTQTMLSPTLPPSRSSPILSIKHAMSTSGQNGQTLNIVTLASNNNAMTQRSSSFVTSLATRYPYMVTTTANMVTTATDLLSTITNAVSTAPRIMLPSPVVQHNKTASGRDRSRMWTVTQTNTKQTIYISTKVMPWKETTAKALPVTPASYENLIGNSSLCTTTPSDGGSEKWPVVPLVVSVSCVLVFVAALIILTKKVRHGQRAIQLYSEMSAKGRQAQVELHDILCQCPSDKQKPSAQSSRDNYHQYDVVDYDDSLGRKRRRTNSFPMRHHGKADREFEKCLSTFTFIDDRTSLAMNLHRTLHRPRTNSF